MSLKAFLKSKTFLVHLSLVIVVFAVLTYFTMMMLRVYTHHGRTYSVPDFVGLSESESAVLAKKSKLRYEISDSVFVPEAIPGTVIGQYPETGYKVKQNRIVFLTISAISAEKVALPMVVAVSLREAQSRLENAGLRLGKIEYRPNLYSKVVMDKCLNGVPLPDDTILIKGTAIDLIVGKGLSDEVTQIPSLFGYSVKDAKSALNTVGLNIGAIIYDDSFQTKGDSLSARIWKQNPPFEADKFLELGTEVDVWLTVDQEKLYPEMEDEILEGEVETEN